MMGQISEHLEGMEQDSDLEEGASVQIVKPASCLPGQQGSLSGHSAIPETATSNPSPDQQGSLPHPQRFSLSQTEMNPPEIHKVVVEHVVKTDTVPAFRLRPFSGKIPKPANKTDYETWRSHIELLLADPNLAPLADVVKGLGSNTIPSIYLKVLDSAFALVQDGEELFAQFLNTLQEPGEKPSAFLQRLQLTLNTVMKRGGILSSDFNKHLLKQFCRGCWDSDILNKLQLENLRSNPPCFAELLLLLRTEEGRQLAKENLMKKHLTASKPRAAIATSSRPRAGYCFKCGEDRHMSAGCANPPNPPLVLEEKKQLQKRQQAWDSNNKSSN
uniref:Paraneoplastic antigen Ma-like C-terminal domain-containing protein n=1 Tax=Haplochromis burtoni TaxID=8153 RepID=A0A3Q2VFT6_HAPBU